MRPRNRGLVRQTPVFRAIITRSVPDPNMMRPPPAMPPTMKDVAREAGVSTATVSYVLNDKPDSISEETRARVSSLIESGLSLRTYETVAVETPASRATSFMVGGMAGGGLIMLGSGTLRVIIARNTGVWRTRPLLRGRIVMCRYISV